jgi:hypothetical protein
MKDIHLLVHGTPSGSAGGAGGVLFHPAIDAFLRNSRSITEGENWTADARKLFIDGFTNQLDLFLPIKSGAKGRPRGKGSVDEGATE